MAGESGRQPLLGEDGAKRYDESPTTNNGQRQSEVMMAVKENSGKKTWAQGVASKPRNMLIFFTLANILLYMDRGAIASAGVNGSLDTRSCVPVESCSLTNTTASATCVPKPGSGPDVKCHMEGVPASGFQGDFHLSGAEDGWLQSMFLVGLLIASPIFASLAKSKDNIRLCGWGLALWSCSVFACGFTLDFFSLALCRTLVGVGEAALITIVPNFIDTCAPVDRKTKWLAVFCIAIPSGTALGYAYGGLVTAVLNWRFAFFIEGLLMVPLMAFAFFVPIVSLDYWPKNKGGASYGGKGSSAEKKSGFAKYLSVLGQGFRDVKVIASNRVYVIGTLGYSIYSAMMGVFAYWGPKAGQAMFPDVAKYGSADTAFGLSTVVAGIIGTMLGGYMLDRAGVSIAASLLLCSVMTFVGVLCLVGCIWFSQTVEAFIGTITLALILVFSIQGPINIVAMWTQPYILRPFACAMMTVSIHVFGDVPSAPIAGMIHDHLYNKFNETKDKAESDSLAWKYTLVLMTVCGFTAVGLWFMAYLFQTCAPQKIKGDEEVEGNRNAYESLEDETDIDVQTQ